MDAVCQETVCEPPCSTDDGDDGYRAGIKGVHHYEESEYNEASTLLTYALDRGCFIFADVYADICKRQLDDNPHDMKEAAYWHIVSACTAGNPDVYSYLVSVDERVVDEEININARVGILTERWRAEEAELCYHSDGER